MRSYGIKIPGMSKMSTEQAYIAFGAKLVADGAVKVFAVPIEKQFELMIIKRKSIKVANDALKKNNNYLQQRTWL